MRRTPRTGHWILAGAVAAAALGLTRTASAAQVTWNGAGGNAALGTTDVNDANQWLPTNVPTTGNDAYFLLDASTANRTTLALTNLTIPATASAFTPDGLLQFKDTASNATTTLTVLKSLTLSGLKYNVAASSGSAVGSRMVLGDASNAITVNLTGAAPFDLTQTNATADQTGFNGIKAANVIFNLSNSNITFSWGTGTTVGSSLVEGHMAGGASIVVTTATDAPKMNFTAVAGTISLDTAGKRNAGTLALGFTMPVVRSDQTWNCDATGYIGRGWQQGTGTTAGPYVIDSADGSALNNLDAVNIVLQETSATSTSSVVATGMLMRPGEYGSLNWDTYNGITSSRDRFLNATGALTFKGYAVRPGSYAATSNGTMSGQAAATSPYGLIMRAAYTNTDLVSGPVSVKILNLAGYDLTVVHGVILEDYQLTQSDSASQSGRAEIQANGTGLSQTITIGGDLRFYSVDRSSATRALDDNNNGTVNADLRALGILGGTTGVTVKIGGSFDTNVRSHSNANNLRFSTVQMTGGTVASNVTWEVGDASTMVAVPASSTYYMKRFEVGDGVTGGHLMLVNASLNDNSISLGGIPSTAKIGEKLAAGTLHLNAGSTLDVSNLDVFVATALEIAPTASIDLNSGTAQSAGYVYTNFMGLGDQTVAWNALSAYVADSDSPGLGVTAILQGGNTYWQATAVPEPGSLGLVGLAAAGFLGRRRRK